MDKLFTKTTYEERTVTAAQLERMIASIFKKKPEMREKVQRWLGLDDKQQNAWNGIEQAEDQVKEGKDKGIGPGRALHLETQVAQLHLEKKQMRQQLMQQAGEN